MRLPISAQGRSAACSRAGRVTAPTGPAAGPDHAAFTGSGAGVWGPALPPAAQPLRKAGLGKFAWGLPVPALLGWVPAGGSARSIAVPARAEQPEGSLAARL